MKQNKQIKNRLKKLESTRFELSQIKLYLLLILLSLGLAASAAFVHILAPVVLLVGFWLILLSARSPFTLMLFFTVFLIGRLAEFFPILGAMQGGKILSLSLLAIFIVSKLQKKEYTLIHSPLNKWFVAFNVSILLSSFMGTWPAGSLQAFYGDFVRTTILCMILINVIQTRKQVVIFQMTIAAVCSAIGGYALLASVMGKDPLTGATLVEGSRAGLVGAFADPNNTALVILMSVPFLLFAVIESKSLRKLPFLFLSVLAIGGIISTQSRGGLLGLAAAVGIVMNKYIKNKIVLVAITLGLLGALAVASNISERKSGGAQTVGIDASSQGRLDAWVAAIHMLVKHPLTGVGFDQYVSNFQAYAIDPLEPQSRVTHNAYLQVASELGLFGFFAYMMFIYISLKGARDIAGMANATRHPSSIHSIISMSLFPNTIAILIPAFFLSVGYSNFMFIHFSFTVVCVRILKPTFVHDTP